jgi:hypothetical protein
MKQAKSRKLFGLLGLLLLSLELSAQTLQIMDTEGSTTVSGRSLPRNSE